MKKISITTLIISLMFFSCSSNEKNIIEDTNDSLIIRDNIDQSNIDKKKEFSDLEIDSLIRLVDTQLNNGELIKYYYPSMSYCGGALNGFYNLKELKFIDATFSGELGFKNRKIYWDKGNLLKIIFRDVTPEWSKYEENFPPNKFEYDPKKMTYTDTTYQVTFRNKIRFEKIAKNKIISTKTDYKLIERLVECGLRMKSELERDKVQIKDK